MLVTKILSCYNCERFIRGSRCIVLALLATGETYLVDLRSEHRGRFELEEHIQANEDDPESYHR